MQQRAQDEVIAASWTDKLKRDRTFAETADYEAKLQAVTAGQIGAALKKHLDLSRISTVKAGSFAKPAGG
jgi:hypothetical protein